MRCVLCRLWVIRHRNRQSFPLQDCKADAAYREIILRRSSLLERRFSDLEADIAQSRREWLFLAESCRPTGQGSNDWNRPISVIHARLIERPIPDRKTDIA